MGFDQCCGCLVLVLLSFDHCSCGCLVSVLLSTLWMLWLLSMLSIGPAEYAMDDVNAEYADYAVVAVDVEYWFC